jgi:hypothetical protein
MRNINGNPAPGPKSRPLEGRPAANKVPDRTVAEMHQTEDIKHQGAYRSAFWHSGHMASRCACAIQNVLGRAAYVGSNEKAAQFSGLLGNLGYVAGKNLSLDHRSADGDPGRLAGLAGEPVRTKPDVLVAGWGTLSAKALKAATATIPIGFVGRSIQGLSP